MGMIGRMMGLSVVFLAGLFGFALAGVPLSLVVGAAGLQAQGVAYADVQGSIWDGRIVGLRQGDQSLGDIAYTVRGWALLTGRLVADVQVTGPVANGRGRVTVAVPGELRVDDARVRVDLAQWQALHPRLRSPGARFTAEVQTLAARLHRPCVRASGQIRSNALVDFATDITWSGPPLAGTIGCEDEALVLALSGEQEDAKILAAARIGADFVPVVEVELQTNDLQLSLFAQSFGFQGDAGVYTYRY